MSVKLADTLAPMGDFAIGESKDIDIEINGTNKRLQQAYEDGDLGGGSAIQVDLLPHPSVDELGKIYEFIGSTGTYVNGYFYECVSDGEPTPTYSWVQKNVQPSNATATDVSYDNTTSELVATNVQDAIDEIKGGLGTASGKNFTDLVRPNSHELVESGSVYSAINNALSSIYTPRGELTCAELTSSLLIEDNVGNIYTMSDSGTTSALFINGAGLTINIGDNVGIIKAGADTYLFNYTGNAFDLTDYQKKDLSSPIAGASTVEGAIAQNTSDIEKIKAYTAVSNTDANMLTTTGLYYLTTGCTNIPSAYCILQVQSKNTTSISDDIAQYTVNTEGDQYYRVRVNGTWSSWKKLATTDWVSVNNYVRHTNKDLNSAGWYKIAKLTTSNYGSSIIVKLTSNYNYYNNVALTFCLSYANSTADCKVLSYSGANNVFTSIRLIDDYVEVYYAQNVANAVNAIIMISENNAGQTQIENFVADSTATGGIEWNPNNVLVATTDSINQLKVINATDTIANPDILNLLPIGNYCFTWGAMKLCTDAVSTGNEEWQITCYSSDTTISAIGNPTLRWQVAYQRSSTPFMLYRQYSHISKAGEPQSYQWSDWQKLVTESDLPKTKIYTYTGAVTSGVDVILDPSSSHDWWSLLSNGNILSISITACDTSSSGVDTGAWVGTTTGNHSLILTPKITASESFYRILVTYTGVSL